jgi:hypothetical protein
VNVRFDKDEVRLRLDRKEAEGLARGEPLSERVRFPGGGRLLWRVDPGDAPPGLTWEDSELTIAVSGEAIANMLELPASKDLALRAELPLDGGGAVALVVEIDLWSGTKKRGAEHK